MADRGKWSWVVLLGAALLPAAASFGAGFTSDFRLESCSWSSKGEQNPYFSLRPGYRLTLEGEDDGTEVLVQITVLRERENITFQTLGGNTLTVQARVVEEQEFEDGEIVEISHNYYARCVETSDIYYFGEEVDIYQDGEVVSHDGAWRAGVDGALPGLIMPGTFLLGSRYFQEIAPNAQDQAKHTGMSRAVTVPAGSFSGCVSVRETSAIDPDAESFKVYCPGVGLVIDDVVRLVGAEVVAAEAETEQ